MAPRRARSGPRGDARFEDADRPADPAAALARQRSLTRSGRKGGAYGRLTRPRRRAAPLRAPRARLPRRARVRARPLAQHARRLPLRPAPARRAPGEDRRRRADRRTRRPRGLPRRAGGRRRLARDAAAQGGVPALLLSPPAPRGDDLARPDGRPARAEEGPEAAAGADARRGRQAAFDT